MKRVHTREIIGEAARTDLIARRLKQSRVLPLQCKCELKADGHLGWPTLRGLDDALANGHQSQQWRRRRA